MRSRTTAHGSKALPNKRSVKGIRAVRAAGWVAALAMGIASGCGHSAPGAGNATAPTREPTKVSIVSPEQRDLPRSIRATGTLFGDEEATIAAKVSGRVIEVERDLGDSARPGEELARIEATDYELARDERRRAYQEVLASLGLEEMPESGFKIESLPAVERARLQSENAKARFERGKVLAERTPPLISDQDYADLKTAWDVAESNLRVEGLTAEAKLAEARTLQAQEMQAQQRVLDTVIRAPLEAKAAAGNAEGLGERKTERVYEIASRMVSVGDFVQIGSPLFRLVDASPLKLRATIPERRLGRVKVGQKATVRVESRTRGFEGTVSRVAPSVDVINRSFLVEVLVPNEGKELRPGSFGVVEILVGEERVMVVPETAVVTFAGVHKVVAVVEGKAKEVRVELGDRLNGMVEIVSGLKGDEQLVQRPPGSLATGMPVVVGAPAAPAPDRAGGGK